MDGQESSQNPSDILYPECHLNSPIVRGKIAQLHVLLDVNQPYRLKDDSIINITKHKIRNGGLSPRQIKIRSLGKALQRTIKDLDRYTFEPYPTYSQELLRLDIPEICDKIRSVFAVSDRLTRELSSGFQDLWLNIFKQLGNIEGREGYDPLQDIGTIPEITDKYSRNRWYRPFLTWFSIKYDMRWMQKTRPGGPLDTSNSHNLLECKSYTLVTYGDLIMILNKLTLTGYILTPELVLMYCDVVEGRWNMSAAGHLDKKSIGITSKGEELWELVDSLFSSLGEEIYNVIALLEPLSLALIQLNDPVIPLRGAFMRHVLTELQAVLTSRDVYTDAEADTIVESLLAIFHGTSIDEKAEIFSFFRTFGHPSLEAVTAADKVRAHMYAQKAIKLKTLYECHAVFCTIIINGYRERHGGQWPPCDFPDHVCLELRNAQGSNTAISYECAVDNYTSFIGFKFRKFIEPQLDEDLTIYMKDKALSPRKEAWDSVYPDSNLYYKAPESEETRRLIEVFINDENFNPEEIINYVESGDWLKDEKFNISYSLKEKEIKQEGRLFAKMTYKMRAVQVLAETLLAKGIGELFSENGMVKGEIDLLKRLTTLSVSGVPRTDSVYNNSKSSEKRNEGMKKKNSGGYWDEKKRSRHEFKATDSSTDGYETLSCFLTTDLKKYCLNWRFESTALFGQRCNEIFGFKTFFNWMHPVLERCTIYVGDPYCPVADRMHRQLQDHADSGIFIHNPRGGIEGYCQKLWTLISISAIHLAAVRVGVRVSAMVQGDNQAIAVTSRVPVAQTYKQKKNHVYKEITKYFGALRHVMFDVGHELKLNETIISSKMFVYSKRIYYDGKILPQCLKALTRCVFWSETLVDENRSACSNISTSIAKAIENGYSPILGYCIALYKTCQQVCISLGMTINPTISPTVRDQYFKGKNWLRCAVLIPANVGGFNYMSTSRCFVRNIGDPAVAALADLKRFIRADLLDKQVLYRIMNQEPGDSSFLDWASDPYSCNLPHSQSITTIIKNITARSVLQESPNPLLSGLFTETSGEEDLNLASFLMDRKVILPRVAHEILGNSLTGVREAIAGMLDTTKSLVRASVKKGGLSYGILRRLVNYDLLQYETLTRTLRKPVKDNIEYEYMCSVELAVGLRQKMWIHLTYGRPIHGLETPDPLELLRGTFIEGSEVCKLCRSEGADPIYTWFYLPDNIDLDTLTNGSPAIRIPYFGSATDERSEAQLGYVRNLSKPAKAAIRIAMVYTWAYGTDEISWMEAALIAQTRANLSLENLKLLTPVSTSTNLSHRLKDTATQMKFSSATLVRASRFITISNDNMALKEAGESKDTNLVYQQIMLTGLSLFEFNMRYKKGSLGKPLILHLHLNNGCCIMESPQEANIPPRSTLDLEITQENNKLIYDPDPLKDVDLELFSKVRDVVHTVDMTYWSDDEVIRATSICTAMTIADTMSQLDRDNLKEMIALVNDDDVNSLITEFMVIDVPLFCSTFGGILVNQFAYSLYGLNIRGREEIWGHVVRILKDTSHAVLKVLSNALSHPKIFKRFWNAGVVEPVYGPNLSNQDKILLALSVCEYSVDLFMHDWQGGVPLEIFICDNDPDVADMRRSSFLARHLAYLCSLAEISRDGPRLESMNSLERLESLKSYLELTFLDDPVLRYSQLTGLVIKVFPSTLTYIRKSSIKVLRTRGIGVPEVLEDWDPEADNALLDGIAAEIQQNIPLGHQTRAPFWGLRVSKSQVLRLRGYKEITRGEIGRSGVGLTLPFDGRYLSHQLRLFGINSTSCLKALELTYLLSPLVDKDKDRLYLGEGAGAMLSCYDATLGPCINYYNSGVYSCDVNGQRELNIYPAEVALVGKKLNNVTSLGQRVKVLFNGNPGSTWIGNDECEALIWNELQNSSIGLVHCDMEGGDHKDDQVVLHEHYSVIRIAYLVGDRDVVLISKIAPRLGTDWTRQLSLYLRYWDEVNLIVLKTSNPASTEMYLLSRHPKSDIIEDSKTVLASLLPLSKEDSIKIEKWILIEKAKAHEWVTRELREGSSSSGMLRPYHQALQTFGFEPNLYKLSRDFLSTMNIADTHNCMIAFNRVLKDTIFEWARITESDKRLKLTGKYDLYPVRDSGKLKTVSRRLVLSWISLSMSTRLVTGSFPDQKFEARLQLGIVSLSSREIRNLRVITKTLLDRFEDIIHSITYRFLTKEIKILMKILGAVKMFGARQNEYTTVIDDGSLGDIEPYDSS
ncbi:Large protein [Respirovirus muris]|uniref:RNA-directed RNA polymerase L n=2 Tax=Respirovirus muris TaxID=3052731 RepID=A6P4U7_9MONO|nr:Large protein [Respirovirus muris]BAD74230.1 Large protein [Respirovirus muris]BAF73490.1 large protein [Respirovirus muris]